MSKYDQKIKNFICLCSSNTSTPLLPPAPVHLNMLKKNTKKYILNQKDINLWKLKLKNMINNKEQNLGLKINHPFLGFFQDYSRSPINTNPGKPHLTPE